MNQFCCILDHLEQKKSIKWLPMSWFPFGFLFLYSKSIVYTHIVISSSPGDICDTISLKFFEILHWPSQTHLILLKILSFSTIIESVFPERSKQMIFSYKTLDFNANYFRVNADWNLVKIRNEMDKYHPYICSIKLV